MAVERIEEGVAVVILDRPDSPVNAIDADVLVDLEHLLDHLEAAPPSGGAVFLSGKDHFCVGADISLIESLESAEAARAGSRRGQELFCRLAELPCPTVAAVHGSCLGGGLEWALACDRILASAGAGTRLGLPEVRLGILPAWGGTQRLSRRIGLLHAVRMMAAGRSLDPEAARARGLVDGVVDAGRLEREAISLASTLARRFKGRPVPRRARRGWIDALARWVPPARQRLLTRIRTEVARRAGPHYPAPLAVVDAARTAWEAPLTQGLARERELFAKLVLGATSRNLVGLFRLQQRAKHWYAGPDGADPGKTPARLAVLGAGIMGSGIAWLAASRGLQVILRDVSPEALEAGMWRIRQQVRSQVKKGRLKAAAAETLLARISPVRDLVPVAGVDLIVEAVAEELDLKKRVLSEAAGVAPGAILASNTSALSIARMAAALPDPARLAGLHFFNPVHRMPLVEVVSPASAGAATVGSLVALARRLGKVPVRVADAPGFLVNRILSMYLGEAMTLVSEGFSIASVDQAMRAFGMPMGPLELLDAIGLDVAAKVVEALRRTFRGRMPPAADLVEKMVAAGRLGAKGGLGFYRHDGGTPAADQAGVAQLAGPGAGAESPAGPGVVRRLVLPMVAEAARALEEKIVDRPGEVDLALVMGTGWPPFRGGLLRYADQEGMARVVAALEDLSRTHGARLAPPAYLRRMAEQGRTFHARGPSPASGME
ncbi:MAG: 3-hydroxyacyl-CoA dehydrogenase NAD-binding domain-containing protein [Acidobacteriota bacterium]